MLLVSPDGRDGSLSAHQDARLYGTLLAAGKAVEKPLDSARQAYVHIARGEPLSEGDGAHIETVGDILIEGRSEAEVLLFDLP